MTVRSPVLQDQARRGALEAMRPVVEIALQAARGKLPEAARALGTSPRSLRRWIQALDLAPVMDRIRRGEDRSDRVG